MAVGTVRRESCRAAVRQTTRAPLCRPQRRERVLFAATVLAHGEHLCVSGVLVVDWNLCFCGARRRLDALRMPFEHDTLCAVEQRSAERPAHLRARKKRHASLCRRRAIVSVAGASTATRPHAAQSRWHCRCRQAVRIAHTCQRWRPTTHRAHIVDKTFQTLLLFLSCSRFLYDLGSV